MSNPKLIPAARCRFDSPFYTSGPEGFFYVGVLIVTAHNPPKWKTWDKTPRNPLLSYSYGGFVDGLEQSHLITVHVNLSPVQWVFDSEKGDPVDTNRKNPAIVFFRGSDDFSCGLRFPTFEERDCSIEQFGEELGFLPLQTQN